MLLPNVPDTPSFRGPPPSGRELLATWGWVVGGIGVAAALGVVEPTGLLRRNLGGVAALLFVLVPDLRIRGRGEAWMDYGLPWWGLSDRRTWMAWGRGFAAGVGVSLVVLPLFALTLVAGARAAGYPAALEPRLPPGFILVAATQLLAIALPEELFYRGWMQTAWGRSGPSRRILGAEIGPGFLATQALFAAGHLVTLQPVRLATFFPGLLFGWLRARTGNVVAPAVAHALSNLLLLALDASLTLPP
ncbi:MAG: CPBP family intramembrane metalloprotease [Deltaproteobacteria bacterium]|nr:CPBP family intramembrane metalloprotease [Deltaproteobacteria bacterium]